MSARDWYGRAVLKACIAGLLIGMATVVSANEPTGEIIDSQYEAIEANAIELTVNSSGEVVAIRAKGCSRCPASSILPSKELVVEVEGRVVESVRAIDVSGRSGVIHIYWPTNMAYRVSFPKINLP